MSLWTDEINGADLTADQKAELAAMQIQREVKQTITQVRRRVERIRKLVADGGGKAAVAGAIDDADTRAELQAVFNELKAVADHGPTPIDAIA